MLVGIFRTVHAVVGRWKMDLARAEQQEAFLAERIVPRVREAAGFVCGYWSRPTAEGIAYSFIVFADESAATIFAESVRADPHNRGATGVEGDELSVVEISATA
jgi:hypothetical protein